MKRQLSLWLNVSKVRKQKERRWEVRNSCRYDVIQGTLGRCEQHERRLSIWVEGKNASSFLSSHHFSSVHGVSRKHRSKRNMSSRAFVFWVLVNGKADQWSDSLTSHIPESFNINIAVTSYHPNLLISLLDQRVWRSILVAWISRTLPSLLVEHTSATISNIPAS